MMKKFVSVVVPTYNRCDTLKESLPSLANQTYPKDSYEILLCDNNSNDSTIELLKQLNIINLRHIKGGNLNRASARNLGTEEAKGEIILFTDADIIADFRLIEEHIRFHELYEDIAVVGCEIQVSNLEELEKVKSKIQKKRTLHPDTRKYLSWLYFLTGNASVSRKKIIEAGMFDENFSGYGHEDLELGYRLSGNKVKILYNAKAVNYHWHPVEFDEQCRKMYLAGISTVRFYNKYKDPAIKIKLGMNFLAFAWHKVFETFSSLLKLCERYKNKSKFSREIVLQYYYINGIKDALLKQRLC